MPDPAGASRDVRDATTAYETWLGKQLKLRAEDLDKKHAAMSDGVFPFLRATFYRWLQLWREVCPELSSAPPVLAVGDLHVENFGTWRDSEGRLVWGISDFDESYPLPFTLDLVRLSASALVATDEGQLGIGEKPALEAILEGFRKALDSGGEPFVLAERHRWLRNAASGELRDPDRFWDKMQRLPDASRVPADAARALKAALPDSKVPHRIATRTAGLGSLGRERYVAVASWRGGAIAREAKALAPSAAVWAGYGKDRRIRYADVLDTAIRALDPCVSVRGTWLLRRLAPDCSRIELSVLAGKKDESKLLCAMGWETANIHLGSAKAPALARYLKDQDSRWLLNAARAMRDATQKDWREWKALV